MIFSQYIDDQTFAILLEKFIGLSKPLDKKRKELFFSRVTKFFAQSNMELAKIRDLMANNVLQILYKEKQMSPFLSRLTRLVKSMYIKFTLNFQTLTRLHFRMIRHVKEIQKQIKFFWIIISSFCDLAEIGLIKDISKFLNVFLEDKYLIPYFVKNLISNFIPYTNLAHFPIFFKFLMIISSLGFKFFHYEFLFKFCQNICEDLNKQPQISNIDAKGIRLLNIFETISEIDFLSLPEVFSHLASLELPIFIPTLIMITSFPSNNKDVINLSNQFFHELSNLLLHPLFFDNLLRNSSDVSLSTNKMLILFTKCYNKLLGFLSFNIKSVYKLVFITIAWIMKPLANNMNPDSMIPSIQLVKDSYFETHWSINLEIVLKKNFKKYEKIYKNFQECKFFLDEQMFKQSKKKIVINKKNLKKKIKILSNQLNFHKKFRLPSNLFQKIREQIRKPSNDLFWTNTRKFNLLTHFNEIFRSLSLISHYRLRHKFFRCVYHQILKKSTKNQKKEIFLKGLLRVPEHQETLYLFSMVMQVKSSFCVRSTRLKIVKSKNLNHVTQNFEMKSLHDKKFEKPRTKKKKRRNSIVLNAIDSEYCIIKFNEAFKDFFKKNKNNKIPMELSLLTHLFGISSEEKLIYFINAAQTKNFNTVVDGLLILTDIQLIFVHHIQRKNNGDLYHTIRQKSRKCPYLNYIEDEFIPITKSKQKCFKLKYESLKFHKFKEIHQKPCLLHKNGLEIFLESGKIFSFVLSFKKYETFFDKLVESLSLFFLGNNSFLNIKSKSKTLDSKDYIYIIIQNVECGKNLDYKTKNDLTIDLFNKIEEDSVDNFSLLAGFNILAGKSLSQNNNSFIYPLLSPSKGTNCKPKYSSKKEQTSQIIDISSSQLNFRKQASNKSEDSEFEYVYLDTTVNSKLQTDFSYNTTSSYNHSKGLVNKRDLTHYSGFDLGNFGECLRFMDKKVFSKRSEGADQFEDAFHDFDRTDISEKEIVLMQKIWENILKMVKEGKSINLSKIRIEHKSIIDMIHPICINLLKSIVQELLDDQFNYGSMSTHFHLDLFSNSHFLMRMHPFTEYHLWTKSSFDNMNRTFNSFADHFSIIQRDASSLEIVPFVYCCPEVFFNSNCLEHKNFSGFKLPPNYDNNFYQTFVDDLYNMLLCEYSKDITKWISLIFDNKEKRVFVKQLFGKYFKHFYKKPKKESSNKIQSKHQILEEIFLGNQGSINVNFFKTFSDKEYTNKLFNRNKKNLSNLNKKIQFAKKIGKYKFLIEKFPYEISITNKHKGSFDKHDETEQISPDLVTTSFDNSKSSSSSSSAKTLSYLLNEKVYYDSCGPLKKFLNKTWLSRSITISLFKYFLVRKDLRLLFEFENTLLIFSQLYKKEFIWVYTETGNVTCQMFFDFDESIPVIGNSLGQVIFLKLSNKQKMPFESDPYDQCLLRSSFLDFDFVENFHQYNLFEARSNENKIPLQNLIVSHLWTVHYSNCPISSLYRSQNTKFVMCGNLQGKVIVLDFFTRSLIRIFDSLSFKYPFILKTMFPNNKATPVKQGTSNLSDTLYTMSGIQRSSNLNGNSNVYSPNITKFSSCQSQSDLYFEKKYLSINKNDFLLGPVLSIDVNDEDKILIVSFQSFSLFNANGALLSIFFYEKPKKDAFKKGYFIRGHKSDKAINVLLVTQNAKLRFFKAFNNTKEKGLSSAQNFNYFLNSSKFYYYNTLELLFEEINFHQEILNNIYQMSSYEVVDAFFSQPNILFIISKKDDILKVFKIKLKL
jgi:hypothetical protein